MEWKTIENFPYYEVSDKGDIRARRTKRPMKSQVDKDGYLYVRLYRDGKYYHKRIHRLVLESFTRLPCGLEECHHINEKRDDNRLENLTWVTRQENDSYVKHEINSGCYDEVPVCQMDIFGNVIAVYASMSEAHRATGCSVSLISRVCSRQRNTIDGFRWKSIEDGSTTMPMAVESSDSKLET